MRSYFLGLLLFLTLLFPIASLSAPNLILFTSPQEAQQHCPDDEVVWLNLPNGIWHVKGARWYGRTKHGAFVCKKEAAATGSRASLNGS